ncbi:MAG: uracil phosphoribosyltransferase [Calditrichaeota bacterium]|nr:MAG: uracil phosphoribosyltransferase [Calditrichota bacterium]
MVKVTEINHPLIQKKLSLMRDLNTPHHEFRILLSEISSLMVYEITRTFPVVKVKVQTPMEETECEVFDSKVTLVPILRAGTGMLEGILDLIPTAKIGYLGVYRNEETLEPVEYFAKLPKDIGETEVIVIDPMLATGGSADFALKQVKLRGAKNIRFMCLVAAPEGVKNLNEKHPDVPIFTASLDRELNEVGYILPGLGDAGDRIFGTQ